jgi:3-phenylpropionate/trans-cinnamate dioxygenase ferredoxin reductase subunit
MTEDPIVIVGAGHAGVQVAAALRDEGFSGAIRLVNGETRPPYQRPPLSKAFLKREITEDGLQLRAADFFATKSIKLTSGDPVAAVDRTAQTVRLASGASCRYAHLILATGARQRDLHVEGAGLDGVVVLRTLDDADRLRTRLESARDVVVIGAGFIGLEFAAVAVKRGCRIHVVELADRPMARALTPQMSAVFAAAHRASGIELLLGLGIAALHGTNGKVTSVKLSDGRSVAADLVLAGIGVVAEDHLARGCGLACANGVVVDGHLLTSDPTISAIGDCTSHPNVFAGETIRLESVQNAADQARCVAKRLTGKPAPYDSLPWFWSDQGDLKLQIAGFLSNADTFVTRGDPATRAFSIFGFRQGTLTGVESLNRPGDHMAARRIIAMKLPLQPAEAGDPSFDLKALILAGRPA